MKTTEKINAVNLTVGMVIIGQKTFTGVNKFKVKHVVYSSDGKYIRYKADRIQPNYTPYDGTFSKHVTEKITVEIN